MGMGRRVTSSFAQEDEDHRYQHQKEDKGDHDPQFEEMSAGVRGILGCGDALLREGSGGAGNGDDGGGGFCRGRFGRRGRGGFDRGLEAGGDDLNGSAVLAAADTAGKSVIHREDGLTTGARNTNHLIKPRAARGNKTRWAIIPGREEDGG
jgi:hypothetical protein